MRESASYTGVVLTESSRDKLLEHIKNHLEPLLRQGFSLQTKNGSPLAHHVTINLGNFDPSLNNINTLGQTVPILVNSWAFDEKVAAVGVEIPLKSNNVKPHITIAISKEGKPVYSNNLTNWMPISPIQIFGVVTEV